MNFVTTSAAEIAGRFIAARRSASGLGGYPGPLPATLEDAYRVQDQALAAWGKSVVGWKVGRINSPTSEVLGADRLAGPIFFSQPGQPEPAMPVFAQGFAAGEAEFLLRIGHAPRPGQCEFDLQQAADLIDAVHVGIEIASSPLGAINRIGPVAVISDFGNNNGLVIGPEITNWRASGFESWDVTTTIDGEIAGSGRAASFPDGAIGAARFLFELMAKRGIALQPGQWISSGAVTGVHEARPGQRVQAHFGDHLEIACQLTDSRPE